MEIGVNCRRDYQVRRWTEDEEEILLRFAGIKYVRDLAKLLKRTEESIRAKLKTMAVGDRTGISGRVREGISKKQLVECSKSFVMN